MRLESRQILIKKTDFPTNFREFFVVQLRYLSLTVSRPGNYFSKQNKYLKKNGYNNFKLNNFKLLEIVFVVVLDLTRQRPGFEIS